MTWRIAAALALGLLLSTGAACAEDAPDFHATAHSVAILSLLGDTQDTYSGVQLPIPDGGFDDLAERAMRDQILADLPDASVVRLDSPREPLLDLLYKTVGNGDAGMMALRENLQGWAAAHPADYIVILRKTFGMIEDRGLGYSMNAHWGFFGIGLFRQTPMAFLNITVCDGRTLEIVASQSLRDEKWGSISYARTGVTAAQMPVFAADVRAMLASVVPALTHKTGL
jgi:hypothetical protein